LDNRHGEGRPNKGDFVAPLKIDSVDLYLTEY